MILHCIICDQDYEPKQKWSRKYLAQRRYCGRDCYKKSVEYKNTIFQKGHEPLKDMRASGNPAWKGDSVGYSGVHHWLRNHYGKPNKCEFCGTCEAKKFEWANISDEYKRDRSDWHRLCTSCHRLFDRQKHQWSCDRIVSK